MTAPIREQILAALQTQLATISGITDLTIERNKDAPVQKFPALIIVDGDHTADYGTAYGKVEYQMKLDVEGYVLSTSIDNIGPDMNMLYGKTIQVVMQDVTLGGLSIDIVETDLITRIERGEGMQPAGAFSITFDIKFSTAPGDPFTLAP